MDKIYKNNFNLVYGYLYTLTNDHELAEELTQDTFYSAIKNISKFKNQCSISTWLCAIAKNKYKSYLKKSRRFKMISYDESIESLLVENVFEENICDKEYVRRLYEEIHKLDDLAREVIYLKIQGGFTFGEIGKMLNKSEAWARVTFYREKTKLKEALLDEAESNM